MDIAIINTWVLSVREKNLRITQKGAIGIVEGTLVYVGPTEGFNYKNANILIDGTDHVTMPGLINAHVHTNSTLLRGAAQDIPEIEWMNKGIGPLYEHLTQEDITLGSKLGVLEGLRTGTTTFAEYAKNVENLVENVYLPFHVRVVAAETINEINLNRAHLKPTDLYEFDRSKGNRAFQRGTELFQKFKNHDLVHCMYGPQALDMISLDLLETIKEKTREQETKMHMHIAQGRRERIQIIGRYGKGSSTVKILDRHGFLDKHLLAVHCHDTTEQERKLMVEREVNFVCCPSSIGMIDGIIPPIHNFAALGGSVGLGTDQTPGPGHQNMFREMRTACILSKVNEKDPTAFPPWNALRAATLDGAKILGLAEKIGSLDVGKRADVITFNLRQPHLTPSISSPFHNFIPNIVYSAYGNEVDNVIIDGKLIIFEGRFVDIDQKNLLDRAQKSANEIFKRAKDDWINANSQFIKYIKEGWL
ncbi:MAG: amidohydrolase family protein [Promethearchaeota archaeon]